MSNNIRPLKWIHNDTAEYYILDIAVPAGGAFSLPAQVWLKISENYQTWTLFQYWQQMDETWQARSPLLTFGASQTVVPLADWTISQWTVLHDWAVSATEFPSDTYNTFPWTAYSPIALQSFSFHETNIPYNLQYSPDGAVYTFKTPFTGVLEGYTENDYATYTSAQRYRMSWGSGTMAVRWSAKPYQIKHTYGVLNLSLSLYTDWNPPNSMTVPQLLPVPSLTSSSGYLLVVGTRASASGNICFPVSASVQIPSMTGLFVVDIGGRK